MNKEKSIAPVKGSEAMHICKIQPEDLKEPLILKEKQDGEDGVFGLIPNDKTHTMILFPMEGDETAIKLTVKTAKILIAMLDHQIHKWL